VAKAQLKAYFPDEQKLDGAWHLFISFDVTVQVTTFEGAHNPPNDLVTITFSNHHSSDWRTVDFKSRRLKPNEEQCRHPL
jgi:PIN domain nuclease of toxin-antitoxin system